MSPDHGGLLERNVRNDLFCLELGKSSLHDNDQRKCSNRAIITLGLRGRVSRHFPQQTREYLINNRMSFPWTVLSCGINAIVMSRVPSIIIIHVVLIQLTVIGNTLKHRNHLRK